MEDETGYDVYDGDEPELELEWTDEDEPDAATLEALGDEFSNGLEALDRKLGRVLTDREIRAIGNRLELNERGLPDVEAAYRRYYDEADRVEPDLTRTTSRLGYMQERLLESSEADDE